MIVADNLSVMSEENPASVATKATTATSVRSTKSKRTRATGAGASTATIIRDCFAEVFDMVGDWVYLYAITHRDYDMDGEVDDYPVYDMVDYTTIVYVVAAFCVMSVFMSAWTIVTSLGRRFGMNSICCNCTVPRLVMLGIVMEDVPQFAMTVWIDYTFTGGISPAGMLNICSSLTAIVNRMTMRYDEINQEDDEELGKSYYVSMIK
ncbi:hypothetical protein ACHAXA_010281 [Cyclostephanos tholiformis]|jgi:hypothetical protein|uniref:Uncharacterized protein n=1 Tax=Cyclostephanos tholiformis TaxID=382380 RepID=A0ABD3RTA8_9STRA